MRGFMIGQVRARGWERIFEGAIDIYFVADDHVEGPGDPRSMADLRSFAAEPSAHLYKIATPEGERQKYTLQTSSGWYEFRSVG